MADEIARIGPIKRPVNPDLFSALISSIISQQISTKAASTVEARLLQLVKEMTPKKIEQLPIEDIQKCGMTMRKAEYIKNTTQAVLIKTLDLENLHRLEDQEAVKELVKLRGVGTWTAEMLLIHSLQRKDILSYKDLGIRRGIERLYDIKDLSRKEFTVLRKRYSPYGTVASIYLWEISSKKRIMG